MDYLLIRNFLIALFIGALVGLEREKKQARDGELIGGIRTFILIAEAGAISAWLSQTLNVPWIFVAALFGVALLAIAGSLAQAQDSPKSFGMTTEIAAITVFLLGGVALFGHPATAAALGIVTSVVLAYKQPLHGLVQKIGTEDLYAALKLLVATFIILPVLPDKTVDPLDALNPYSLWWLVILISGLSLVGYVAVRFLGPHRGTAVMGLAGGLASSTAVTLAFAKRSREAGGKAISTSLASGIFLAWSIMFLRVLVEVAVVYPPLIRQVAIPLAVMAGIAATLALLTYRRGAAHGKGHGEKTEEVPLKNPFSLTSAMRFALFFALVLVVLKLVQRYFPGNTVYGVAALAGLGDVDPVALSMSQNAKEGGEIVTAAVAIVIAAMANTLAKTGMVVTLAAGALKKYVLFGSAAILVGGAAVLLTTLLS